MAHEPQDGPTSGTNVRLLLAEPLLRGCLIGGHGGLDNAVTWCLPLSEVHPITRLHEVTSGDLAGIVIHLPTASLTPGDEARRLITELARRGAAGLLAWPGPGEGPSRPALDDAAHTADTMDLPLLALGPAADFRSVSRLVASKVLTQSAHVLEYGVRVHRVMGEVFAHGSGLEAMASTMTRLSRSPVFILDMAGETLAHADAEASRTSVPPEVGATIVTQLIAQHRQERAEAEAKGGDPAPHSRLAKLELDGQMIQAVAAPVTVAGEPYGVVVMLESMWPADEHDLAQHRIIAEQGATLVGSELLRQRSVREAQERARDDFVDALLHGRFIDQHELAARSRHYDFKPQGRFAVFVVTPRLSETDRSPHRHRVANAARGAVHVAPAEGMMTLTTLVGPMIVVVRQLPELASSPSTNTLSERQALHGFGDHLYRAMRDRLGDQVRISYGRPGTGAAGVARSYREARIAVSLGLKMEPPPVSGYDDLRVFAAIQEVAGTSTGRSFAEEVLTPLRKADGQKGNLEEIVIAYIEESGNLIAAARRLQLHRNTMLYKLDRVSRALQMDIRLSQTQFMVWLAHHIDTLNDVQDALDHELVPPTA